MGELISGLLYITVGALASWWVMKEKIERQLEFMRLQEKHIKLLVRLLGMRENA